MAQEGTKLIPEQIEALLHSQPCDSVAASLSLIGNKWTVLIMMLLAVRSRRFNELKRETGISQRMLTLTLRDLERTGLVERTAFPTIPPRVDYALTELGHSLKEPILALGLWAIRNQPALDRARQQFDNRDQGQKTV